MMWLSSMSTDPVHGELAIEAIGLVKAFGDHRAVDGVDLAVPAGGVYGLLGPNGAGKTTTVRMLATLLRPDGGTARVLGHDVVTRSRPVRARISLTGQFASIDEELTGRENLMLLARLLGYAGPDARTRAEELLDAFGLTEAAGAPVKTYSGGMRRRLDIAASIIVTPDLLFLDEPTTGLDPRSRNQVWEHRPRRWSREGTTVLLTTQYLDEADQLADRIAVDRPRPGDRGGHPRELKASVGCRHRSTSGCGPGPAGRGRASCLAAPSASRSRSPPIRSACCSVRAVGRPRRRAVRARSLELTRAGIAVDDFALGQPSLDEVFLALTGRSADDERDDELESRAQHDHRHRRRRTRRRRPSTRRRARRGRDRRVPSRGVGVAHLRLARPAEDQARAGAALRRDRVPDLFTVLMFTYLFGGALAGSTREYLQFLLPGIMVFSGRA